MNIWALDGAITTGVAMGSPPEDLSQLRSFSVRLRTKKHDDIVDDLTAIEMNLETFLADMLRFKENWPDKIVYEAPMSPNAEHWDGRADGAVAKRSYRGDAALLLPSHIATTIQKTAWRLEIPCLKVYPSTFRSTFIGKANDGARKSTKERVVEAARLWGYVPETCKDDNRCDAIGIWHWAQKKFGRWQPPVEVLFGQRIKVARQPSARAAADALFSKAEDV